MSDQNDEAWDLILKQYECLRQEQLNKKDKQYQITGLGIGGIATLLAIAYQNNIYPLFLIIPLMILITVVIFDAECHAILNISDYGYDLEERVFRSKLLGWEHWLRDSGKQSEGKPRNRAQKKIRDRMRPYLIFDSASRIILFILYFGCILGIYFGQGQQPSDGSQQLNESQKNGYEFLYNDREIFAVLYGGVGLLSFIYYTWMQIKEWGS